MHVVHCIDTEGPLHESLETKFERLQMIFGISMEPTAENLEKLVKGEIDLGGKEEIVRQTFSSHLTNFMDDWTKLGAMLDRAMSEGFRNEVRDSFGGGWVYSWFCVDHVDYTVNPRRRTIGYHAIFDHYRELLNHPANRRDGLHWHMHPMSVYREAHRCATSFLNSPHALEVLARRIIERRWFPSCFRAGFQAERPDLHWFLEQYVPFDFSNTSEEDSSQTLQHADLGGGRSGDWRLAPRDWGVYHPSHDQYQIPGNCRRWIARALNVLNRFASIDAMEVEKAFRQAQEGKPTLLCIASHDFRDLVPEVRFFRKLMVESGAKFPDVQVKFGEAREAFRSVIGVDTDAPGLELAVTLERSPSGLPRRLLVETIQGRVFGPQPFLAIKTRSKRFIHDNFDFTTDLKSWHYTFDEESVLPEDLDTVGVGASDEHGNICVKVVPAVDTEGKWK